VCTERAKRFFSASTFFLTNDSTICALEKFVKCNKHFWCEAPIDAAKQHELGFAQYIAALLQIFLFAALSVVNRTNP